MATKISKQENGPVSQRKFVVTRSGVRVSEREYDNASEATQEVDHWKKILSKWPDGTKVAVEEYNDKKHRVY